MNINNKAGLINTLSVLAFAALLSWQMNSLAAPEIPGFTICTDSCITSLNQGMITYDCLKQPARYSGCLSAAQTSGPAGFADHTITFSTKGKKGNVIHQFKCDSPMKWNEFNNDRGLDYYSCG